MTQARNLGNLGDSLSGTSNTNINFDSGTFYIDANNNRVGFGTSTPTQIVDIVGTANVSSTLNSGTVSVSGNTTSGNVITTGTISGSGTNITNLSANNLIGTLPSQVLINSSLGTANNVQFNSLGIGTPASGTTGAIRATNDITAYYSDDKLKTKLGLIDNALEKVLSLDGFYYQANETAQSLGYIAKKEVGVSAQQVQKVLPEIVVPAPIDDKYLTVKYEKLIPLLIEAIKELKKELNELKEDKND